MPDPIRHPADIRLNDPAGPEALIGHPPDWALRWGMTALALTFALVLLISWLVRYPDVVQARAVLTTEHPPIRLAAGASAKISRLLVKNGQSVQPGDLLALLDNPARPEDVGQLEMLLEKLSDPQAGYLSVPLPARLQLGSLQPGFAQFSQRLQDLQYFLKRDANYLKINNLQLQIAELKNLNQSVQRQEKILSEEVALARRSAQRDSILVEKNSLSRLEADESMAAYLRIRRDLEALRSTTAQNNLRIRQLEAQILDARQLQSDTGSERLLAFRSDLERLRGEVETWKKTWLLTAPIAGQVALTKTWSEQQPVREGEEVLTIVPQDGSGRPVAKAMLPSAGSGKVKEKMPVHIRLDGFPYQEFGTLDGQVERIAAVPGEGGYEVEISVPASLVTSYGKPIPFRQEMQGTARIVTEKRSLLRRVLERIVAAFETE